MLNEWTKLRYYDPEIILGKFRQIGKMIEGKKIDQKVRRLRTNKLKQHREGLEAAIFCYGLEKAVIGKKIYFARFENFDHDIIAKWYDGKYENYKPIQLKEVVPDDLDPVASVNDEIAKLTKYKDSSDLAVAIHVNKKIYLRLNDLIIPNLNISELWLYGAITDNGSKWFLYGNILSNANLYTFSYS